MCSAHNKALQLIFLSLITKGPLLVFFKMGNRRIFLIKDIYPILLLFFLQLTADVLHMKHITDIHTCAFKKKRFLKCLQRGNR